MGEVIGGRGGFGFASSDGGESDADGPGSGAGGLVRRRPRLASAHRALRIISEGGTEDDDDIRIFGDGSGDENENENGGSAQNILARRRRAHSGSDCEDGGESADRRGRGPYLVVDLPFGLDGGGAATGIHGSSSSLGVPGSPSRRAIAASSSASDDSGSERSGGRTPVRVISIDFGNIPEAPRSPGRGGLSPLPARPARLQSREGSETGLVGSSGRPVSGFGVAAVVASFAASLSMRSSSTSSRGHASRGHATGGGGEVAATAPPSPPRSVGGNDSTYNHNTDVGGSPGNDPSMLRARRRLTGSNDPRTADGSMRYMSGTSSTAAREASSNNNSAGSRTPRKPRADPAALARDTIKANMLREERARREPKYRLDPDYEHELRGEPGNPQADNVDPDAPRDDGGDSVRAAAGGGAGIDDDSGAVGGGGGGGVLRLAEMPTGARIARGSSSQITLDVGGSSHSLMSLEAAHGELRGSLGSLRGSNSRLLDVPDGGSDGQGRSRANSAVSARSHSSGGGGGGGGGGEDAAAGPGAGNVAVVNLSLEASDIGAGGADPHHSSHHSQGRRAARVNLARVPDGWAMPTARSITGVISIIKLRGRVRRLVEARRARRAGQGL
jgi:hypothetical protein